MRQQKLTQYYLRQAGLGSSDGIVPIYYAPQILQTGRGRLGNIVLEAYRQLRTHIWTAAKTLGTESLKALGREAVRTGKNIAMTWPKTRTQTSRASFQNTHPNTRKMWSAN
jgi:hypothetical protein